MTTALAEAEQRLAALAPSPYPLPLGPLAPLVAGGFGGMEKGDWIVPGPREVVGAVLRGCSPERLVHLHGGARPYRVAPASAAPGARALHAVGLALQSKRPVLCFLGPASAANGAVYEALNCAVLLGAPVIWLVRRQVVDRDAPVSRQLAVPFGDVARAFGVPVHTVPLDERAIGAAVAKARGTHAVVDVETALAAAQEQGHG